MPTVLACLACRTGLLARRGDPLCLTCIKASREMSSRPLWLFDSPLLRQALAQVDLPAVPAIVRAACGLSQRDLAAIVGWSPAALSYYERGVRDGMFDIRTALQFADAVGMPRAALLPLVCADPDAGLAAGTEDGTGMELSRRDFGGLAVAAGVAAVMPPVSGLRGVTSSHVRYWQACTDVLYARDRAVGGTVLLLPALQQWQRVRLALKDGAAGEAGRQFLAVAGELALCTGWIALDGGRMPLARPLYEEAREAGSRRWGCGAGGACANEPVDAVRGDGAHRPEPGAGPAGAPAGFPGAGGRPLHPRGPAARPDRAPARQRGLAAGG